MGEPETPHRLMNACPNCGEVIDVSACAPFTKVLCPSCSNPIRVRGDFLNFQIKKKIGEGGMSRVFLAIDRTLGRKVALKILNPDFSADAKRAQEFEREAKITAAISHPNVVKVYSAGRDQEHYFIAMELVGGGSLDEKIVAGGPLPEERVLEVAAELVLGLNAAQEAGLIHRDMKPGNVLFSDEGTSKIVDFGLALILEHAEEDDGEIWATPYYVPPEKLYKEPEDFRSDIYSLGATLFHALAGKPPYSADTSSIEELKAIKDRPISLETSAPHVSMATCELIDRMMARRPDERYSSYRELLEHVNYARQHLRDGGALATTAAAIKTRRKAEEKKARTLALVALSVVVVVLGAVLTYHFVNRNSDVPGGGNGGNGGVNGGGNPGGGIVLDGGRSTTEKFENARRLLARKDYKKAEAIFGSIARASTTRQPTANWALFNLGLGQLFRGDADGARTTYAELAEKSAFSDEPKDADLVGFFARAGSLLGSALPVLAEKGELFGSDPQQAMALLACGLKNWELGALSAAQTYFQAFADVEPGEGNEWVSDFKPLVQPYLRDLEKEQLFPAFRREATYAEALDSLEKSKAVYRELKMPGIKQRIEKRIARLERSVAKLEVEAREAEAKRIAQLKVVETRRMASLRLTLEPFRSGLRFSEAVAHLEEETFEHPDFKQQYEDELYVWRAAEAFVETLIADINRFGYAGPVEQRGGSVRNLRLVAADKERLTYQFGAAAGQATIPLNQVTERSLLSITHRLSANFPEMADYLPRRERRALFAYVVRDWETAKRASGEVKSEEFREIWKRILEREQSS